MGTRAGDLVKGSLPSTRCHSVGNPSQSPPLFLSLNLSFEETRRTQVIMADLHQDPEKLHAAVASSATTLNGEDLDSKTPVPSLGEKDDLDLGFDEKREDTVVESPAEDGELREDEYPSGIKMFFIVLALVLSVFLLSLDMVSL